MSGLNDLTREELKVEIKELREEVKRVKKQCGESLKRAWVNEVEYRDQYIELLDENIKLRQTIKTLSELI